MTSSYLARMASPSHPSGTSNTSSLTLQLELVVFLPPAIYLDLSNVIYHILGHVTKQESIFLLS